MGVGHLKRCLSLAQALVQQGAIVHFVTRDHGLDLSEIMGVSADQTHILPTGGTVVAEDYSTWMGVSMQQDAAETLECIGQMPCDWVIVDHYGIDADWHRAVQSKAECKIAVIDDLANRQIYADLIVDQNWHEDHSKKYAKVNLNGTPILGGPKYAMLDAAYAGGEQWVAKEPVASIGVFMGGGDPHDKSNLVLDAIELAGFEGSVEIVTTSDNPNLERLTRRLTSRANGSLLTDVPNLASFFARHDLQIGAGGGATWERCSVGAPTLALSIADNQLQLLEPLSSMGVVYALLDKPLNVHKIERAIAEILASRPAREEMSRRSRQLVDGLGALHIAKELLGSAASFVHVREATLDDSRTMFFWRNDPSVRSVSRNSEPISYDQHEAWLRESLELDRRTLLMGLDDDGQGVGVTRFDDIDDGAVEVSIYLNPARSGAGMGRKLLEAAEAYLVRTKQAPFDIVAYTMPGNIRSVKLFEKAGYYRTATCFRKRYG
jgi:UDP-2,4-diacetamido-2,4,6-trideoxy-beta-L-altropyranose hydrolase